MIINRHNYETFFLLYVDNELSAAERKAVEEFVKENTDLAAELEILQETTVPVEPVSFFSKEDLYRNEVSQDVQENLLLHLDNELDAPGINDIKSLIATNTAIKQEWEILQQAKLDAKDEIIFKDKKILYRHETSRVVSMRFWRIAAAAAVILGLLFTGITIMKKDNASNDLVKNINDGSSSDKQIATVKNSATGPGAANSTVNTNSGISTADINQANTTGSSAIQISPANPQEENLATNKLVKEKNKSTKDRLENINRQESNETIASTVLNKKEQIVFVNKAPGELASTSIKEKITAPTAPLIDYNSVSAMPDSYATTAAFDEASHDNNKILYMNEETVTRSKVGGLFRKVKRVIERNTNIKTGNGVKIAGFEIAVK